MKALFLSLGLAATSCAPAFAAVTVNSPANGASVTSPFTLSASASPCSSQPIASMGYSLDNSTGTTFITGASVLARMTAPTGFHVLHVKSWGNRGASCVTNVTVTVNPASPSASASSTGTNVVVSSPANGATVTTPFSLIASGTLCSSQPISAFGYSFDNSASTTFVMAQSVSAQVTGPTGSHTLHVKSWGNQGAGCDTDLTLNIVAPASPPAGPTIPTNAVAIKAIQNLPTWQAAFDLGTSGTSSGVMSLVTSPALSGSAREFLTTYSNYGGERYSVKISTDQTASNFVYENWLYLLSPINDIANIEMDINQVMANGQTVIFGFQCDGWSRSWDYTANLGTPTSPNDQWMHSNQSCNPQAWATNTWHHIQVSYSRDASGNVTYKSVWLDGTEQDLNVTINSAFALGWAPTLLTNFQVDGMTALPGTATIFTDNMTVYRW